MIILNIIRLSLLAACITGCGETRDATAEEPVTMKAGNYKVSVSMAGLAKIAQKGPGSPRDICVGTDQSGNFPSEFIQKNLSIAGNCDLLDSERIGNHISGTLSCSMNAETSDSTVVFKYTGAISEKALSIGFSTKINAESEMTEEAAAVLKMIGGVKSRITVKWVGECSDSAHQSSNDDSYESDDYGDEDYADDGSW